MRKLIIGDIHGCYNELLTLIDKAGLSSDDEIIALGDIVDRGPDSPGVLEYFRTQPYTRSLKGNHERKHVLSFNGVTRAAISQLITREQLGEHRYPDSITYLDSFLNYLELDYAILVHAFLEPGIPLIEQKDIVLHGTMDSDNYLKEKYNYPWFEYKFEKPIIVGHHDYSGNGQPFIYNDTVYGIDTDCCFGKSLTGLIYPDFKIISVPSKKNYWSEIRNKYKENIILVSSPELYSWAKIKQFILDAEKQSEMSEELSEQVLHLKSIDSTAEKELDRLFKYITWENERVLIQLRNECSFDELSLRDQWCAYAARIQESPIAKYLHKARKGELTLDLLRKNFERPKDIISFIQSIDILIR